MKPALRLGAAAFAAGALLGPLREGVLAPWLGGLVAALLEAAVLACVLWWLAGLLLPPMPARAAALAGGIALAVVLLAELALGWLFAVSGLAATRAPRSLGEQAPGFLLLAWLAALPLLRRRA